MTLVTSKKAILREAERISRELKERWPDITTRIALETQEGEDALIWITTSDEDRDAVRLDASGLTVDLYNASGLYIVGRTTVLPKSAAAAN